MPKGEVCQEQCSCSHRFAVKCQAYHCLINTDFATTQTELTIEEANAHLRKNHKDTEAANVIYVVDQDGKLV